MKKRKNIITVAIDSPAAAGAGTQAKYIAKEYKLLYLDTGKIYRYLGRLEIKKKKRIKDIEIRKKIDSIKIRDLSSKVLLNDKVAIAASHIAKINRVRKLVKNFQMNFAYNPPKKYLGSVLDGRDITSVIMKDAMFKFYITADLKIRAKRRYLELKKLGKRVTLKSVLKSLKNRDYLDKNRVHSPLKKLKIQS